MKNKITTWLYWRGWDYPHETVDGLCVFQWQSKVIWWLMMKIDPDFSDGG